MSVTDRSWGTLLSLSGCAERDGGERRSVRVDWAAGALVGRIKSSDGSIVTDGAIVGRGAVVLARREE